MKAHLRFCKKVKGSIFYHKYKGKYLIRATKYPVRGDFYAIQTYNTDFPNDEKSFITRDLKGNKEGINLSLTNKYNLEGEMWTAYFSQIHIPLGSKMIIKPCDYKTK